MLTMFRKMLRSKIGPVLFGIVIVGMAVWGIDDIFSGSGGNLVKAGNRGVSVQEFELNVQERLRDLSRQQQRAVTKAEAVEAGIVDQVFQQEVSETIVLGYSEGIGARASTDAVMKQVFEEEAFNNALSGKFDSQVYQDALARNNLTPNEYEQSIRDGLTRTYLFGAAEAAVEPPSVFVDLLSQYEGEARKVSILRVNSADIKNLPDPTDEELRAYFEKNKAAFGEPERRAITVLHFSPLDFRQSVEVTEESLVAAYELGKVQQYSTPQTRRFVEAFFATEAAALQALGVLATGGAADSLDNVVSVSERSAQKDDIENANYSDSLFAVPQGAVTEPLLLGDQWVIARVEEVIPGDAIPFEDVRELVHAKLLDEGAQRAFDEAARNLDDLKGEGLTLQEIGERVGAPAISFAPVDQRATTKSNAVMVGLAGNYPQALRGTAELFEGEKTDRYDLENNGIYLAQLDRIVTPAAAEFEDARERVLVSWQVSNRNDAVTVFAEQVAAKINRGESTLAIEAEALGKSLIQPGNPVRRSAQAQEFPQASVDIIFSEKSAKSAVVSRSNRQGEMLIFSIDEIIPASAEVALSLRPQIRQLLDQQLGDDLNSAFDFKIPDAIDISVNEGAFAAYKARNASQ